MQKLKLCTLALLTQLACASFAASAPAAAPSAGLDTAGFDKSVRTQDDLFKAVNGGWIKATEIPADKSRFGSFELLRDQSDADVRKLIDELSAQPQASGSKAQKIADYYKAFLDTAAIEKLGLAPIKPLLDEIAALKTRADLAAWLGAKQMRASSPVRVYVMADAKQPLLNSVRMVQSGLGLPDRDYYLKKDDARMIKARDAYRAYLTTLATLSGDRKDPAAAAERVMALEQRIAAVQWDKVENRDPVKTYNPMTLAELSAKAPGFDWAGYLRGAGLGGLGADARITVTQPSAMTAIAGLLSEVPLADWQQYLTLHTLNAHAEVLPQALREAEFKFRGEALTGAKTELPRWQKATNDVNQALGEAIGELYVARHFPPAYKARMQTLVGNLMAAYKDSINGLDWMSAATKAEAQDKLSKYVTKIGYPDKWRDYGKLEVRAGDAFGNNERAGRFQWERMIAKAGKPVDRAEWWLTPQTVNAYYSAQNNEIVFPAAILQPPFFDMNADDAVNYGAIGAVIGHEISHGFDDKGSQFDGDGVLRNWWTPADRKAFDAIADRLVAQFAAYEPIAGKQLNGKLTLGENIADLSGLQIAYKAYQRSLAGKPAAVIGGYSGEQRFFLGFSQVWREKAREERALQMLTTDPHSPGEFRANGTAINHDGFHQAFDTKPGDKMHKPESERIKIW
ncbi:M13 family metallopeptidase [Roseateles oligotrophus]|uniref:M13 family metallopeptidase n=1 Tax=Roseateles oligotrophus TaxID=1769250 RepID=A0ABT2YAY8_9BURK|nr:M13 family metallopeptidase [Roseateles oligotrophus]MCV2367477.1 M13 family metallopeptidase [Roseateles oligotrophus]